MDNHANAFATSSMFAATVTGLKFLPANTSGSFKPWPVTVQTMRLPAGIFLKGYFAASESQHLNNPAMDAALAGSTKMPSLRASQACASRISSSSRCRSHRVILRLRPGRFPTCRVPDPNRRRNRFGRLDDSIVKNRRRTGRLKTNHHRQPGRFLRRLVIAITSPVGGDVPSVANRQQMKIGRVTQHIDNFKCRGFLSGNPKRIDRVND